MPEPVSVELQSFPDPTPEPTPVPTPEPTPAPTPFSFLWMTDTQHIAGKRGKYKRVGAWLKEHIEPENIVYMLGTGDLVGVHCSVLQWEQFHECFDQISDLPSIMISGNHDMNYHTYSYEPFRKGVYGEGGADKLENAYNRGQGRYALVNAGGIDWLLLGMSYHYHPEEMDWMDEVLAKYPDHKAVILLHDYMDGAARFGPAAKDMFGNILSQHDNVVLVLCGHYSGYVVRTDKIPGETGHYMQTILLNLQDLKSRMGTVQILTIDPVSSELQLQSVCTLNEEKEIIRLTIPLDLNADSPRAESNIQFPAY